MRQPAGGRRERGPRLPGIVLKVDRRTAVVLAEGGRFLRVPAVPGWEPGEEVWIAPPAARGVRRLLAGVAAGCVALAGGGALWMEVAAAQVAAVVSVDINPSVQMAVNGRGVVLSATAMDPDGQRILAQGPLVHLPVARAVAEVVSRAVAAGLLGGAGQAAAGEAAVLVAAAPAGPSAATLPPPVATGLGEGESWAEAVLRDHHLTAAVALAELPGRAVPAAHDVGLSLGQYAVYQDVRASGVEVPADAFRGKPVGQVLAGLGVPPEDVPAVVAAVAKAPKPTAAKVIQAARQGERRQALEGLLQQADQQGGQERDGQGQTGAGHGGQGRPPAGHGQQASHSGAEEQDGGQDQHGPLPQRGGGLPPHRSVTAPAGGGSKPAASLSGEEPGPASRASSERSAGPSRSSSATERRSEQRTGGSAVAAGKGRQVQSQHGTSAEDRGLLAWLRGLLGGEEGTAGQGAGQHQDDGS
jgi:hypothetical protein